MSELSVKDVVFQDLDAFKAQHEGKSFNLTHCWIVINGDEKFKARYVTIRVRGGKATIEDYGKGEKPQARGKTNSKSEDKRDVVACLASYFARHDHQQGFKRGKETARQG
ncbi:Auxin response factor 3 [Hordeum vulgare]|nr:Auxin response factor 3 [Hordeum vulgare]